MEGVEEEDVGGSCVSIVTAVCLAVSVSLGCIIVVMYVCVCFTARAERGKREGLSELKKVKGEGMVWNVGSQTHRLIRLGVDC